MSTYPRGRDRQPLETYQFCPFCRYNNPRYGLYCDCDEIINRPAGTGYASSNGETMTSAADSTEPPTDADDSAPGITQGHQDAAVTEVPHIIGGGSEQPGGDTLENSTAPGSVSSPDPVPSPDSPRTTNGGSETITGLFGVAWATLSGIINTLMARCRFN